MRRAGEGRAGTRRAGQDRFEVIGATVPIAAAVLPSGTASAVAALRRAGIPEEANLMVLLHKARDTHDAYTTR